ncbi:hypothetical protein BJX96DRAFT_159887 [Aspergillus floccosus]
MSCLDHKTQPFPPSTKNVVTLSALGIVFACEYGSDELVHFFLTESRPHPITFLNHAFKSIFTAAGVIVTPDTVAPGPVVGADMNMM